MANLTDILNIGYSVNGVSFPRVVNIVSAGRAILDTSVTTGGGAHDRDLAFEVDNLKSIVMYSDKAVSVVMNGSDTIALTAAVPVIWYTGCGTDCPITVDVAGISITNASGSTARVQIVANYGQEA